MSFYKKAPLVRVYYNKKEEYPLVFCIDYGLEASVVKLRTLHLQNCSGEFKYNGSAVGEEPKAWIELRNVVITVSSIEGKIQGI